MRLLIAALLAAAPVFVPQAHAQTMDDRARAAAAASRAKTSDSDALRQNYVTPGLSGGAISTVDGRQSFNSGLACQKTATLLEILVQPGPSGDIQRLTIARDKDLDGRFDTSLAAPFAISGICANGVIACAPGSWTSCRAFKWEAGSGDIALDETSLTELAGCYCVNNSCGTNLVFGNLASVLKDIGGGVVGALTTSDPRLGVAQASVDGPVIRYTGAQTTACTANPALTETRYRANPTAIQGDAFAASASSRVFTALAASSAGAGKAEQIRACTIEREFTIKSWTYDDIVSASGAIQSASDCGTGCRRYRIGGDGNCTSVPPIFTASFDVSAAPARLKSAKIVGMGSDDWVQARVNGNIVAYAGKRPWLTDGIPSGDCKVDNEWYNSTPHDFTSVLAAGSATIGARVRAGGSQRWGWVDVEIQVETGCETSERLIDLCSGYAIDPACTLRSENVDGVETFQNGVNTGLRPLSQTRLFGTGQCTFQYTRDFFKRDRRYACVTDTASPPAPDLSRAAFILDRSTESLLADRTRNVDGTTTETSRAFALPARPDVPACEAICKTRTPHTNSDVAPAGVTGTAQNAPIGYDSSYHACTAENVCPAGSGEEIVAPCGCLDDFPEAVVMMQTVRLGGADMVCTSAVR